MSTVGTSECEVGKIGRKVLDLRHKRKWNRAKLISRIYQLMGEEVLDHINEGWLERLENKRMSKPLSRKMLEVLCNAFDCTPFETSSVMLHADRTMLGTIENRPSKAAEVLNYITGLVYADAREILEQNIGSRQIESLSEEDLFELVLTAFQMVSKHRRRS